LFIRQLLAKSSHLNLGDVSIMGMHFSLSSSRVIMVANCFCFVVLLYYTII